MTLTWLALAVAAVAAVRGLWSPCGLSMVTALNPVSESTRGNRFWVTAGWYVFGAALGGLALGAVSALGALVVAATHLPLAARWAVVSLGALAAFVSDARLLGRSLPVHPRQVDERWLARYRRWIYAAGFGAQIGTGFATYIMTATTYLVPLLAVLTGSARTALAVGLAFGLVRGLTILVAAPARTPERLRSLLRRVDSGQPASARVAGWAALGAAVIAGWQWDGPIGVACVVAVAGGLACARAVRTRRPSGHEHAALSLSARM